MRDPVLTRSPFDRFHYENLRRRGVPDPRCPVCRVHLNSVARQYTVKSITPLGGELYVVTCGSHYCRAVAEEARGFYPTDQTAFGAKGNCLSACVAMVLGLSITSVPQFNDAADWYEALREWLKQRGFAPLFYLASEHVPPGYSIAGGTCSRSSRLHACLAYEGRIVWDPNPLRHELVKIRDYIAIVTLEEIAELEVGWKAKRAPVVTEGESIFFQRQLEAIAKDVEAGFALVDYSKILNAPKVPK